MGFWEFASGGAATSLIVSHSRRECEVGWRSKNGFNGIRSVALGNTAVEVRAPRPADSWTAIASRPDVRIDVDTETWPVGNENMTVFNSWRPVQAVKPTAS